MPPLPPSRRDNTGPPPRHGQDVTDLSQVRHQGTNLRSLNPGFTDGHFATPKLVPEGPTLLVGGDELGGNEAGDSVVGEWTDRHTLLNLDTQVWTLSYIPISETLHVRWHPDDEAGVPWLGDEHWTIDDDSQDVIITAAALATAKAEVGDVFSAQYLITEGDQDAPTDSPLEDLIPIGTSLMIDGPSAIDLPDGTEIGSLIVAVCATSLLLSSAPSDGTITDGRLTQVGYCTWMGIATHLGPVTYSNPSGDRLTGTVATFEAPAYFQNVSSTGPGGGGVNSLAVGTVAASAAVMGFIEENRNGFGGTLDTWPAGYTKLTADSGSTICKAYILYWPPDGTGVSPAGSVDYTAHANGHAYVDVVGLGGEEE